MKIALLILLALAMTPAAAEKVCPKGKSYDRDSCYEIVTRADGTKEIYPQGRSYDRSKTWVVEGDRIYRKGRSYDRSGMWEVVK